MKNKLQKQGNRCILQNTFNVQIQHNGHVAVLFILASGVHSEDAFYTCADLFRGLSQHSVRTVLMRTPSSDLRHAGPSEPLHTHGRGKHNFGFRLHTRREKHHQKERQKEETTVRHGLADKCICSAFSHLKLLVHLLQLCHGVPNVCLQCHAALIRLPLRLPEQIHLLLQTPGVTLLRLTPTM